MIASFRRSGISFSYPSNWSFSVENIQDDKLGWTVTVESPVTAFFMMSLYTDDAVPSDLVEESLVVMRGEYPMLEITPHVRTIENMPCAGYEIDFVSVDRTVEGFILGIDAPAGAILILTQVGDYDAAINSQVLEAMIASIKFDNLHSSIGAS